MKLVPGTAILLLYPKNETEASLALHNLCEICNIFLNGLIIDLEVLMYPHILSFSLLSLVLDWN